MILVFPDISPNSSSTSQLGKHHGILKTFQKVSQDLFGSVVGGTLWVGKLPLLFCSPRGCAGCKWHI